MAIVSGVLAETAHAQERSWPEANHDTILWSARSCYAEALWSEADCSALLHVIRKRATKAGWPFLKMLKAYSVTNWMKSALAAHKLRLGANQDKDQAWNKKWQQLVTYVVDVLQDRVNDPCPKADHWAAAWYSPKSPMRKVRCMVPTDNQFWVSIRSNRM
jgi:hypothetical protein